MEILREDKWWDELVICIWLISVVFIAFLFLFFLMVNVCEFISVMRNAITGM